MFGGIKSTETFYDDFWYINILSKKPKWIKINNDNESKWPSKRCQHSMIYYNNNIYIYGGCGSYLQKIGIKQKNWIPNYMNDLWVYNIKSKHWKLIECNYPYYAPPKTGNSSVVIYQNHLFLFGGHYYDELSTI